MLEARSSELLLHFAIHRVRAIVLQVQFCVFLAQPGRTEALDVFLSTQMP